MKTLKISDEAHDRLTSVLGRLVAETGKMKTYSDAIEVVLSRSVMLSPELMSQIETFTKENPQLGYCTLEEFVQDAVRFRLNQLSRELQCTNPSE